MSLLMPCKILLLKELPNSQIVNENFSASLICGDGAKAFGKLVLKPQGIKPVESTVDNSYIFHVLECENSALHFIENKHPHLLSCSDSVYLSSNTE